MGKPSAPPPPDYAAAATAQGQANENSAIATNFLNQANQQGPYGSLTYSYDQAHGMRLPDGTVIPQATATTSLSPEQQHLLDQQTNISSHLNDLATQGIGYVGNAVSHPVTPEGFPSLATGLAQDFTQNRDQITNAMMDRLQPRIDHDRAAMESKLANQGITNGSAAYNNDQNVFQQGVNDQRTSALLAGDQEEQNQFNRGLATSQFGNQAQQQAIQEADYFQNQPLNMLNALRSGNQVNLPQFGNVSAGAQIAAAPVYQATSDQYSAAMQRYQAQMQAQSGLMGGLATLGSAGLAAAFPPAALVSDRRLKRNILKIGQMANGLGIYLYNYVWDKISHIGVMADEVAAIQPEALGPVIAGFQSVDYGVLRNG